MDAQAQLLRELTAAPGAPGFEGAVRTLARGSLSGLGGVRREELGRLLVTHAPLGPRTVRKAHMDEVGFLITRVTPLLDSDTVRGPLA